MPFRCNLQRYNKAELKQMFIVSEVVIAGTKVVADELCELMVGLCTLNQVDP